MVCRSSGTSVLYGVPDPYYPKERDTMTRAEQQTHTALQSLPKRLDALTAAVERVAEALEDAAITAPGSKTFSVKV